jgi:hypothetical protein
MRISHCATHAYLLGKTAPFIRGNIVGGRPHESAGLTDDMDSDESDIGTSLIVPMAAIQHG